MTFFETLQLIKKQLVLKLTSCPLWTTDFHIETSVKVPPGKYLIHLSLDLEIDC